MGCVCVCDGIADWGVCVCMYVIGYQDWGRGSVCVCMCVCDRIAGIPEIFLCKDEKVQYPDLDHQLILCHLIK